MPLETIADTDDTEALAKTNASIEKVNEIDADIAAVVAATEATDAKAVSLGQITAPERPGDSRPLYTTTLTGAPESAVSYTGGTISSLAGIGRTLLVAAPVSLGTIKRFPLYADEVLYVSFHIRRATVSGDPFGDGIEFRVKFLSESFALVGDIEIAQGNPDAAEDMIAVAALGSAAVEGIDHAWPAGSAYAVPYLNLFGSDNTSHLVRIEAGGVSPPVSALINQVVPVQDGERFRLMDNYGNVVFETDPALGIGIGGSWFRRSDLLSKHFFQMKDLEEFRYLGLDAQRGLELPHAWLRSSPDAGALFRIMDAEGFIFFQIKTDGTTSFAGSSSGGSDGAATVLRQLAGRVMPNGVDLLADISDSRYSGVSVLISSDENFANVVAQSPIVMPLATDLSGAGDKYRTAKFRIDGLEPNARYYYKFVVDGEVQSDAGTFHTFPEHGVAAPFSFIIGSCSRTMYAPTMRSLEAIAKNPEDAWFLVHLGDITYPDINLNDVYRMRAEFIRGFTGYESGKKITKLLPMMITWDDHDFVGPPDSLYESLLADGTPRTAAVPTQLQVYRETALPYPFAQTLEGETDLDKTLIAQEWTVGKVRYIMPDGISQRTLDGDDTYFGNGTNPPGSWNQMQWLKDRLVAAGTDGMQLVVLCLASTWTTGTIQGSLGYWFTEDREELSDHILSTPGIPSVLTVSGDMHGSLIDDGVATDYSSTGGLRMAHVSASAFWSGTNPITTHVAEWLGVASYFPTQVENYCLINVLASGAEITGWEVRFYAEPYDVDGNATLLGTYSTNDAEREIGFVDSAANVGASTTAVVVVERVNSVFGIGPSSATWTSSNGGQTGTVVFEPNQGFAEITVNTPAAGAFTVTLSAPVGKNTVLGATTVTTLTVV